MPRVYPQKIAPPRAFPLKEFYQKRNKVLIIRAAGGLGDILMHRMMFESFKNIMPGCHTIFALPPRYRDAVIDHPFIDEVVDFQSVAVKDYLIWYDTTNACHSYELAKSPFSEKHRSDIWAYHCGLELQSHDMHIRLSVKENNFGAKTVAGYANGKKVVAFCPISAMVVKNLLPHQIRDTAKYMLDQGLSVIGLHTVPIAELQELGIPVLTDLDTRQWMSVLSAVNYVVTVDSAAFHYAGGVGKPLTGIFTAFDGKVYGKYYKFNLVQLHRDDGNWDCGPCYDWGSCPKSQKYPKPCLTELKSSMIADGVRRMLSGNVDNSTSLPVLK